MFWKKELYASSNVHSGPEQMYALDETSLHVVANRMQYDVRAETIETRRLPRSEWPEHPLFATSGLERTPPENGNIVTSWLRTNPGFALRTGTSRRSRSNTFDKEISDGWEPIFRYSWSKRGMRDYGNCECNSFCDWKSERGVTHAAVVTSMREDMQPAGHDYQGCHVVSDMRRTA